MKRSRTTPPTPTIAEEIISYQTSTESIHSVLNWKIDHFSLICPNVVLLPLARGSDIFQRSLMSPYHKTTLPNSNNANSTMQKGVKSSPSSIELEWAMKMRFHSLKKMEREAATASVAAAAAAAVTAAAAGRGRGQGAGAGAAPPAPTAAAVAPTPALDDDDENYSIGMHFLLKNNPNLEKEPCALVLKIAIVGPGGETVNAFSDAFMSYPALKNGTGWDKYLTVNALWEHEADYIVDDALTLKVELTVSRTPLTREIELSSTSASFLQEDLLGDFAQLLSSGQDSDVAISCGEKLFKVHSTILKARSPVFQRMFESGMHESISRNVKIEDVEPLHFEAFLKFLYTAAISPTVGSDFLELAGLLQLADKYEVLKLKSYCCERLFEVLTLDNAGEIAVLAFLHNAGDSIRQKVVGFCLENWATLSQNPDFRLCLKQHPEAFLQVEVPEQGTPPDLFQFPAAKKGRRARQK